MEEVFFPKSIAVIGASSDSEKERKSGWLGRLLQFGFKGRIYPINPKVKEILGIKAFPSIGEVPDSLDYVVMAIPRHLVPASLNECVSKGVKVVHIYTAGFSETGTREGIQLQKELEEIIQTGHTRVIGPNCMGVYCPSGGLSFDIRFPKEKGSITFISQTGVGGRRLISLATGRGLRFSKAVSYGNAIDLNVTEFLEYAVSDPETGLILLYVEGLTDGRRFFNLLRECRKPVVLLKAGLSESGSGAVASHTASLAGSRQVWEALFRQERSPWRGSDGCATVPLGPGRTLWLFGDTWMKPDGTPGRKGGVLINNSLALQRWDTKGPQVPTFHWTQDPTSGTLAALLPQSGRGFLWPLGGILLDDRLFLFVVQVVFSPTEFSLSRALLLVVQDPEEPPERWHIRQIEMPCFSSGPDGSTFFCGSPFLRDGSVYVYGVREDWRPGGKGRSLVLARIPGEAFVRADFSNWRYCSAGGWSSDFHEARSLFDDVSSEYSVSWLPSLQTYVAVYSGDDPPGLILGRFAPEPEGPWSEAVVLHRCHDENWNPKYSYYAGKAHPELAAAGNELIVTYATNGDQLEEVVNDERLYWPRFVRVTIDKH